MQIKPDLVFLIIHKIKTEAGSLLKKNDELISWNEKHKLKTVNFIPILKY